MDINNQEDSLKRPFLAYEGDENYIFISYAHKDAELVFSEIEKFHDEGYPIWYDQGLTPGQEWDEEIEEALLDASLMVVFISENSMASINVVDEIKLALEEKIDIVPIYLEKTKLAKGLRLRLSQKHAIFKYQMSENDYLFDSYRAFNKAKIPKIEFEKTPEVAGTDDFDVEDIPQAHTGDEPYIFVSYDHRDMNRVFPEIKRFQDDGYNLWYDEGIELGNEWLDDILQHIDGCGAYMVFVTKNSVNSISVKKEFKYALRKGKRILPIYLDDFDEIEMDNEWEYELCNIQGILKNTLDEEEYVYKYTSALDRFGFKPNDAGDDSKSNDFYALNRLIQKSNDNTIVLEDDFISYGNEDMDLRNGIKLDKDNLVIDGRGHTIDAGKNCRIFDVEAENITLKNIRFKNAYYGNSGGALTVAGYASLRIDSCDFLDNGCAAGGGAIYSSGKLEINDTKFANNFAEGQNIYGGAIKNDRYGVLTITNSIFEKNHACDGGAIVNHGKLSLYSSKFDENDGLDSSGAILNYRVCSIGNSDFTNNVANCNDGYQGTGGGAIYNYNAKMDIMDSIFSKNLSKKGGGVIYNYKSDLRIHNSKFEENSCKTRGSSLINDDGAVEISKSSFTGFISQEISASEEGKITLNNCRFKEGDFTQQMTEAMYKNAENKLADQYRNEISEGRIPDEFFERRDGLKNMKDKLFKKSAEDLLKTLNYCNFDVAELSDERNAVESFSDAQLLEMAKFNHELWCEEKISQGWKYGELKNNEKLETPYLVPWEQLPAEVQQYDIDPLKDTIGIVDLAGLKVVRKDGDNSESDNDDSNFGSRVKSVFGFRKGRN